MRIKSLEYLWNLDQRGKTNDNNLNITILFLLNHLYILLCNVMSKIRYNKIVKFRYLIYLSQRL